MHRRLAAVLTVSAVLGAVPQALPAGAASTPAPADAAAVVPAAPPRGHAWIEGTLTDQAGRTHDGINVEAWSTGPGEEIVASNLTYAGDDAAHPHGVYRLEVPFGTYRLVFSRPSGEVDDEFRTQWYQNRRTVEVDERGTRLLGTTELVHEGQVASVTTAKLSATKVKAGGKATVTVTVASPWVSNVGGVVVVRVGGRKLSDRLTAGDHGRTRLTLPKLRRPGTYPVLASFAGTDTVRKSAARPARLKVVR